MPPVGSAGATRKLKLLKALDQQREAMLRAAAERLRSVLGDMLSRPGSGRIYPSRTGSGYHQASAPGEPPAPDTWFLQRSRFVVRGQKAGVLQVGVEAPAVTALEFGSRNRRMLPRPFMRPSLDQARAGMNEDMAAAVQSQLRSRVGGF